MSMKDFQVLQKLGSGSFSDVYKVKRISDQEDYAMKKVKLAKLSAKEKEIVARLPESKHQKLLDTFKTKRLEKHLENFEKLYICKQRMAVV